jgi:hypothetical protein
MLLPFFDQWPTASLRDITCFCDVFMAALDGTAASYAYVQFTPSFFLLVMPMPVISTPSMLVG